VCREKLDNGLRVVLSRDPSAPVVAVNLWYNVGSRNERPGRTGFAHLFEHMMFQGSENVPEMAHFALIEQAGGSLNGSTWLDRTNYYETLPAHYLELGLWLESDRLGWLLPAMTQEKLDNQRDVVKNERRWRVDNQPYGDWDERIQAMMYPPDHPYHHSVIGSMEDLDAASLEDVEQFFRTYYAPNNAVLSLCRRLRPGAGARSWSSATSASIPRGRRVPPIPGRTELPPSLGGEVRDTVEQDISLARVYQAYRTPPYGTTSSTRRWSRRTCWGGGRRCCTARWCGSSSSRRTWWPTRSRSWWARRCSCCGRRRGRAGIDAELEAALTEQIEALSQVTTPTSSAPWRCWRRSHLTELQTVDERADQLSMYTTLFDDPGRINTELARVRAVTTADVRAFARATCARDNRACCGTCPRTEGA
jgi:zinc protease